MLEVLSVPLAPARGGHVQQIKKAAVGISPSPTGATSTRPYSSADPLVTGESPVCIPHTPPALGSGPRSLLWDC